MRKKEALMLKANRLTAALSPHFGVVEQQMVLFAICTARLKQQRLTIDHSVRITAKDFAAQFGTDENTAFENLKEAAEVLFCRAVTLYDKHPASGKDRVTITRWITSVGTSEGDKTISIRLADMVLPYLIHLGEYGEFTADRLAHVSKTSRLRTVRLYESLAKCLNIGNRELEIAWLKKMKTLEDKDPVIKDLKKRVIDLAGDQTNGYTDGNTRLGQIYEAVSFRQLEVENAEK